MTQENLEYCKHVRNELEQYYNGEVYKCPVCGEIIHIEDINKLNESNLGIILPCGCEVDDVENIEQLSLYDYFNDVFDIIYYIGSEKEVRGVRLMIACGGPNVFVDTFRKTVELYWWTETAVVDLLGELCEEITEQFAQVYVC